MKITIDTSDFSNDTLMRIISEISKKLGWNYYDYQRWAESETNPIILDKLAEISNYEVKSTVAINEKVSPATLRKLSKDRSVVVRINVASNPNTPEDVLEELSHDSSVKVLRQVAANRKTPLDSLNVLSFGNKKVCRELAERTDTSQPSLATLATNPDEKVRIGVAKNPNTDLETIILLSSDKEYTVRAIIASRITDEMPKDIIDKLSYDEDSSVRAEIAKNSFTSLDVLERLSNDVDSSVRAGVASNENTSSEILVELAQDNDERVRAEVALNQNTPAESLKKLSLDRKEAVLCNVAKNPKIPTSALECLFIHENWKIRKSVASNISATPKILEELSKDKASMMVRVEVACNPSTPICIVEKLYKGNEYFKVTKAAKSRLEELGIISE